MSAGKRWEPGVCKRGTPGLATTLVAAAVGFALPDAAAGLALPNAAAPQETTFGMLISPSVVCRATPSQSAAVAGVYRQTGAGWRERVVVGDSAVDAAGERWVAVERSWERLGRCWVPGALVVPGSGDLFLAMADRLLAMSEGVALADWVTAYNYFGLRRYGEPADDSAVRQLRRLEVLTRALQAAQAGLTGQPDPLALAWLESLGDEVEYLEDRGVRERWAVKREAVQLPAGPADDAAPGPSDEDAAESGSNAETRDLAIIASAVSCRFEPSRTARGYTAFPLDMHFTTERPDTVVSGEAWVSVANWWGCWVPRSETAPAGTDEHVLAIADRFLTSGEGRTLDHSIRVYNVLASRHQGYRDVVDRSAVLTLRRLQVLGEVLETVDPYSAGALARGWATQLEGEVRFWSIGAVWHVRDEAFLKLFEAHRTDPAAEEILWEMVTGPALHDCEGDFRCTARVEVADKLARYWTEFPRGPRVAQAVAIAAARLDGFLETCKAARGAESGSREANWWKWVNWEPDGAELAQELLATLTAVREVEKATLVELFDGLAACAADMSAATDSGADL